MVNNVTMVMSNKILSRGHNFLKLNGVKKKLKKETVKQTYY